MHTSNNRFTNRITAILSIGGIVALIACSGTGDHIPKAPLGSPTNPYQAPVDATVASAESAAPHETMITAADLTLGTIDKAMAAKGKATYDMSCQACHSLGANRIVGPGWKDVTKRREPAWIMNMIVHTDAMLSEDAEAKKMLYECLVRMPNQNLTRERARQVLEFMRTL
jgi:cytochrome c2